MGNACETYCSYEESAQLNFQAGVGEGDLYESKTNKQTFKSLLPEKRANSGFNSSFAPTKNLEKKKADEQRIFWLRGQAPARSLSPFKQGSVRPLKKGAPLLVEEFAKEPPVIQVEQVDDLKRLKPKKQAKAPKIESDKFPFQFVQNVETDQIFPEQFKFSQKLDLNNDPNLHQKRNNSPKGKSGKQFREEEIVASSVNNKNDLAYRMPPLGKETIETDAENIRRARWLEWQQLQQQQQQMQKKIVEPPPPIKRSVKDAAIQKNEDIKRIQKKEELTQTDDERKKVKLTDVSTGTDTTPLKTRAVQELPPPIEEVISAVKFEESIIKPEKTKKIPKKQPPPEKPQQQLFDPVTHGVEIVIDPDEEMLLEGEMLKFKPGIEKNFISRWIQLSTRSFRYYKNHYHSICYLTRPISAIPLYAIEKVSNYSIENQDYKKRDKNLYSYMFEIQLAQDYEDIFFFREFEVNGINNNFQDSQRASPERVSSGRVSANKSGGHNSRSKSPQKGSLIISPDGKKMIYQSPAIKEDQKSSQDQSFQHDKVTRIIQGHLMPIRDMNKGKQKNHYLEDQQIIQKDFGQGERNVHGDVNIFTWSNRQNEWYNSERRFIFSCKSEQERKKWITAIKLAVQSYKEQLKMEQMQLWDLNNVNKKQSNGEKQQLEEQMIQKLKKELTLAKSPPTKQTKLKKKKKKQTEIEGKEQINNNQRMINLNKDNSYSALSGYGGGQSDGL